MSWQILVWWEGYYILILVIIAYDLLDLPIHRRGRPFWDSIFHTRLTLFSGQPVNNTEIISVSNYLIILEIGRTT